MDQISDPRRSPCFYCDREKMSKVECALICDRLSTFIQGKDWRKSSVPSPTQMQRFAHYVSTYKSKEEEALSKLKELFADGNIPC